LKGIILDMKNFLIGLVVVVLALGGGALWFYKTNYTGQDYYVKITTDGTEKTVDGDNGGEFKQYEYNLTAVNKDGEKKEVSFDTVLDAGPIRKGAFLKVEVHKGGSVLNWEEVQKEDVPTKALSVINK
jgi:uncharacterized protein (TIGR01655 family)